MLDQHLLEIMLVMAALPYMHRFGVFGLAICFLVPLNLAIKPTYLGHLNHLGYACDLQGQYLCTGCGGLLCALLI